MNHALDHALRQIEKLIIRDAEALDDPAERQAEFQRRLERTRRLAYALGSPHEGRPAIHIGGTSGKGSVAMICESILQAAGLRVGTHTSPYLQSPLEKVRVGGRLADAEQIIPLSESVLKAVEQVRAGAPDLGPPHYAEAWLALALRHFADQDCQADVIEVGMGGRYDSTNILTPRASAITTVHYDHVRVLGNTLPDIAFHKAGIIKPGIPAVAGEMPPEALAVIEQEVARQGARLIRVGRELSYHLIEVTAQGGRFDYSGLNMEIDDLRIGLLGEHQIANATVALAALELFSDATGVALDEAAIRAGLRQVHFAGRLEVMQEKPRVLLDGAHNEEKVGALVRALHALFERRRLIMVLGLLEAKNAGPILERLGMVADVIITTAPHVKGKPAIPPDEVARFVRQVGKCEVIANGEPLEAVEQALALAADDDLVVVTGSLYLIGTVRERWYPADQIVEARTMFPV